MFLINSFSNVAATTNQAGISAVLSAAAQTDQSAGLGTGATYGSYTIPAVTNNVALTVNADNPTLTSGTSVISGTLLGAAPASVPPPRPTRPSSGSTIWSQPAAPTPWL